MQAGEAHALAQQEGAFFLETSAKEGTNVAAAFQRVLEEVGQGWWGTLSAGCVGSRGGPSHLATVPTGCAAWPCVQIYDMMKRKRLSSSQHDEHPHLPAGITIPITVAPLPLPPRRAGCCG